MALLKYGQRSNKAKVATRIQNKADWRRGDRFIGDENMAFTSNRAAVLSALGGAKARALEIVGGMAETYAKQLCPVDTGRLRNSISHAQQDENTEVIGTNVEYAPFVELGTRNMAARPYLRPAAENHGTEYKDVLENELRKG